MDLKKHTESGTYNNMGLCQMGQEAWTMSQQEKTLLWTAAAILGGIFLFGVIARPRGGYARRGFI